ncbi:MAG: response regulator [Desulfobacteraceae bacterium]|nr:response regulator [Desulfobacteraceae bacterium]
MNKNFVILVVDDEEMQRKMLSKILGALGYAVLEAEDGRVAVELAGLRHPNLILMDIQLPVMDGLAATRRLKDDPQTQAIPVIALTALAMSGDRERALAAGCDDYLAKPIMLESLVAKLNEWLWAREVEARAEARDLGGVEEEL